MEIVLEKCTLRPWRRRDVDSLPRYANNRRIWANVRDRFPHPYTRADAEFWVHHASNEVPSVNFAIDVAGVACGGIGLILGQDIDRRSAEVGYWLGEEFWGRGIVTDALKGITAHGFATFDLVRIWASVFETNPASMRVLEKAGFVREGILKLSATKDGLTIDTMLYALVKE